MTSFEMHFIKQLKNIIRWHCFWRYADLHTHTHTHSYLFILLFLQTMNKHLFSTANLLIVSAIRQLFHFCDNSRYRKSRNSQQSCPKVRFIHTAFICSSFGLEPIHDSETRLLSELTAWNCKNVVCRQLYLYSELSVREERHSDITWQWSNLLHISSK